MILGHEFSINVRDVHFKFTPYNKFNLIIDRSGNGKTHLINNIAANAAYTEMRSWAHVYSLDLLSDSNPFGLILFDERSILDFIHTFGVDVLTKSNKAYLIIFLYHLNL